MDIAQDILARIGQPESEQLEYEAVLPPAATVAQLICLAIGDRTRANKKSARQIGYIWRFVPAFSLFRNSGHDPGLLPIQFQELKNSQNEATKNNGITST